MIGIFHLAIPCRDLDEAESFYRKLGFERARRYEDRITLRFYDAQVVCHLSPEHIDREPKLYPRHFGYTFYNKESFRLLYARAQDGGLNILKEIFTRFEGKREEHASFFLLDPSNNVLEFKYYLDPKMVY